MRARLMLMAALTVAAAALAADTGHRGPQKVARIVPGRGPDPAVVRQGGDTVADAVAIPAIPSTLTGTTTGYEDDYDELCPNFHGGTAPDVVYSLATSTDLRLDLDTVGSSFDTRLYVYDADLNLVACNDDDIPGETSVLWDLALEGFGVYYIVVDGTYMESGDYVLTIAEHVPCVIECPPGGVAEGEPPLVDGYLDAHNGGCNSPEFGTPFGDLYGDVTGELTLCGVSGWYQFDGGSRRDTDWFRVHLGGSGISEVTGDAELPTFLVHIAPPDCGSAVWNEPHRVGPCSPASMTIVGPPGEVAWFWVGPTTFSHPSGIHPHEYDYVVHFSGLQPAPVATETRSWNAVKEMFR